MSMMTRQERADRLEFNLTTRAEAEMEARKVNLAAERVCDDMPALASWLRHEAAECLRRHDSIQSSTTLAEPVHREPNPYCAISGPAGYKNLRVYATYSKPNRHAMAVAAEINAR
jgi:hypothetical protein